MPPINQAAVSAGVIAVSVAVAAAIAIYESPELQRMANDLRRRIALALHSIGDGIQPEDSDQPLFNRPEDAEGFLRSSDVDADDETRKRQREELLYWNAMKLSKELEKQTEHNEKRKRMSGSTTFDDFLQEDKTADEKGTYVYNSGADVRNDEGLVRRRGASEGARGLNASLYANPFADEHGIDYDEHMQDSHISPERDELSSDDLSSDDLYAATPTLPSTPSRTMTPEALSPLALAGPILVSTQQSDVSSLSASDSDSVPDISGAASTTAVQDDDDRQDAFASIQAWAQQQQQNSSQHRSGFDFYSPLPVTPAAPLSEMSDGEMINEGQLTPTTDSMSIAGSGVDISHEMASQNGSSRYYDVMSEDEDGIPTPAHSWTEVGSIVSESEDGHRNAARA